MRTVLISVTLLLFSSFAAIGQELKDDKDKSSYSVGVQMGNAIKAGKDLLNIEMLIKGLTDVLNGAALAMQDDECQVAFRKWQQDVQQADADRLGTEGKVFLEENGKKEGVVTLPSGLQYKVLKAGSGASPGPVDTVKTQYAGRLVDGTEFDSSIKRNEPFVTPVNRVIPGWTEALQLMKEGDKWELYIPQGLAYGAQGAGNVIPPYSTLIFEMELLEVVKQP